MTQERWVEKFDCQACGACCCNTERNRDAGDRDYVEVLKTDRLYLERRILLRSISTRSILGRVYLKLIGEEQRCLALEGDLREGVGCNMYEFRPSCCRKVSSGDEECLKARRFFGLPLNAEADRARLEE